MKNEEYTIRSVIEMSGDHDNFYMTGKVNAYHNDEVVAEKSYEDYIPRQFYRVLCKESVMTLTSISPKIFDCAINHQRTDEIKACEICGEHLEEIRKILNLWYALPKTQEAIRSKGLINRVTAADLPYDRMLQSFITEKNLTILCSENLPDHPIVMGYSEKDKATVITLRFIDSQHNSKEGLDPDTKSYATLSWAVVPNVGYEPILGTSRFYKTMEGLEIRQRPLFAVDGGGTVDAQTAKLVKGEINGQQIA